MSSPVGFDTDRTRNFSGGLTFTRIGICLDFDIPWIFAFGYKLTDYMRAHIQNRLKFTRQALGVFDSPGLNLNISDFVTCGQYSAPAVKNHAALRFIRNLALLLFEALFNIMIVPEKL